MTHHLLPRDNDALEANPPVANNNMTTHGSNLNWAITALHGVLLIAAIIYTYLTPRRRRIFNYFSISLLTVATIYYFVLASNLGSKSVPVQFGEGNIPNRTRQVFYARWIGYLINFALVHFALTLMSGVSWADVLYSVGLAMAWGTMLLLGGLVGSSYKWGFFVFALLLWGLLAWQVLGVAGSHARTVGGEVRKTFMMLAGYELFLMLLYHVSWGVSEGGNRISNDAEQIFYAVLDTLSQGVFAILLLLLGRRLDLGRLRLEGSEYGRIGREEDKRAHGHRGTTNGSSGYQNGNGVGDGRHDGASRV